MKTHMTIDITTSTLMRILLIVMGVFFLFAIRDVVMIVLVSIVIASAVEPMVKWFIRHRIPRVLGALIVYVGGIAGFISVVYLLIPPVFADFQTFFTRLPVLLEVALRQLQRQVHFLPVDLGVMSLREAATNANVYINDAIALFVGHTSNVFASLVSFILILVISFYLAVQEDGVGDFLRIVVPKEHEAYILGLWKRSELKIGRWLQGQILLGVIIGVLVFIALTILQVRQALILAVLSAIFEIIPYFGPVMAAIPAIAVAAIQQPLLGLIVAGVYFVVQQMENHLIYPQVVRKTVGVPPLLAVLALLIGGTLAGIGGIIISIPLAVVLVEFLNDVADRKKNLV